jgi:hypothetical protein
MNVNMIPTSRSHSFGDFNLNIPANAIRFTVLAALAAGPVPLDNVSRIRIGSNVAKFEGAAASRRPRVKSAFGGATQKMQYSSKGGSATSAFRTCWIVAESEVQRLNSGTIFFSDFGSHP